MSRNYSETTLRQCLVLKAYPHRAIQYTLAWEPLPWNTVMVLSHNLLMLQDVFSIDQYATTENHPPQLRLSAQVREATGLQNTGLITGEPCTISRYTYQE